MTHTPGPWKILTADDGFIGDEEKKDLGIAAGGIIAEVFYRIDDDIFADVEANATLIAAAPDLLDELENMSQGLQHWIELIVLPKRQHEEAKRRVKSAETIIRKARGEA